jgi:hypothetical protein
VTTGRLTLMQAVVGGALILLASPAAGQDLSSCKGNSMKRFVGKPVERMQKVRKNNVRYVCTTCPMTKDYRIDRLTVLFDKTTRLITEMRCV